MWSRKISCLTKQHESETIITWDWFQTDPNGSGPKIGPDRPSVYMGPFWNQSGMRNGLKQIQNWTCHFAAPVLDLFRSVPDQFLRDLGILKSDSQFGTGTSFARTVTLFPN